MAAVSSVGAGTPDDFCAEHHRYNPGLHVLVDTGQADRFDSEAGLFLDLAAETRVDRLTHLKYAAGKLPGTVVAALGDEHLAVVVRDDCRDAD